MGWFSREFVPDVVFESVIADGVIRPAYTDYDGVLWIEDEDRCRSRRPRARARLRGAANGRRFGRSRLLPITGGVVRSWAHV
ncbi:hypothetical protein [Embleya sp. NPDC059259]|uniref:hypothetical protein n=1 Tax=unclassified Embleya TaxID=2699296 RepID=UPI00367C8DEC